MRASRKYKKTVRTYTKRLKNNNIDAEENKDIKNYALTKVKVLPKLAITKEQYEAYLLVKSSMAARLKHNIQDYS